MIRSFFRHSFLYSLVNIINKGIGILLTPLYTRVFEPADYGLLDWVLIIGSVIIGIANFQISQGLGYYFSHAEGEGEKKSIAKTTLTFIVFSSSIALILILIFPDFLRNLIIGENVNMEVSEYLIILLGGYILMTGLSGHFDNLLKWTLKAKLRFLSNVIQSFTTIGLIAYLVLVADFGVEGVLMGRIIGQLVAVILVGYITRPYLGFGFNVFYFTQMIRFSAPLVLVSLSTLITSYADRIFIKSFIGYDTMGLYGIGFKFASILKMMFIGITGALSPLILNNYKDKGTPKEIVRIFEFVLVVSTVGIVTMSLFSHEILQLLTTPSYYAGYIFIPFVAATFMFDQIFQFAPGLTIAKKTKTLSVIFTGKLILNLILNYFAVIHFGAVGVAAASLIVSILALVLVVRLSQKDYFIPYAFGRYILAILVGGGVIGVIYNIQIENYWFLLSAKIGSIALYGGFLILIGVLNPKKQFGQLIGSFTKKKG